MPGRRRCRAGASGASMPDRRAVRLAAAIAALAVLAGCTGRVRPPVGDAPATSTTVAFDARSVRFVPLSFDLDAAATPPPGRAEQVRDQVMATLDGYLRVATLDPVVSGAPVGDLGPFFTAAAAARLGGSDRPALVDEGLPPVSEPRPSAAVGLRALVGPDGQLLVVAALVDIKVAGLVEGQPLAMTRQGTFVLIDEGGWKIDGYELRVTRDAPPPAGVSPSPRVLTTHTVRAGS